MKCLLFVLAFLVVSTLPCAAQDETESGRVESGTAYSGFPQAIDLDPTGKFNLNYFAIFYGPSLKNPNSFQPSPLGVPDPDRPLILRNVLGLGYSLSELVGVSASAAWSWQPVLKQQLQLHDPFLRLSHNSLFYTGGLNLYADVRAHFPVTSISRDNDLLLGVQFFQALTYDIPETRLTLGLYTSERGNIFGGEGYGDDLELYVAPNVNYQVSPTVAFTVLYEFQFSHTFGRRAMNINYDGSDIQPGVRWDITRQFWVNPYLNILPSNFGLGTTSFGLMMNWMLM